VQRTNLSVTPDSSHLECGNWSFTWQSLPTQQPTPYRVGIQVKILTDAFEGVEPTLVFLPKPGANFLKQALFASVTKTTVPKPARHGVL
jgi:hypothetical protein